MFCEKCGAPLNDGENVCPVCGSAQTAYQSSIPSSAPNATPVLVFGIISIALASYGLIGLIFAIIAGKKVNVYLANGGQLFGKAKVGNILRRIALPLSIVMTVFWTIYIIAIAAIVASGDFSDLSYAFEINKFIF